MVDKDILSERGRSLEDEYFRKRDAEIVEKMRKAAAAAETQAEIGKRTGIAAVNPAGKTDKLIFTISSAVQGRTITRDALAAIASTAKITLSAQAGVSLDNEAANLVRYQQAFQASVG